MSLANLNDPGEPLHITAAMALLAQLRDTFHLPHPEGVRFTKPNGMAVVDVATFAEVAAWGQALDMSQEPRSTAHTDGSATHSVWASWRGWDLRVVAHVDAPPSREAHMAAVAEALLES